MAAQRRGSVKVLVQPENGSLEAMAAGQVGEDLGGQRRTRAV
jgi:hypothetical protein